jgi:hypothetical protein
VPAALWHKPLREIKAPELLAALVAIRPHERARNLTPDARIGETVRRIRQRLDAVFEDAIFHGRCSGTPAAAVRRKLREALPLNESGELAALPPGDADLRDAESGVQDGVA